MNRKDRRRQSKRQRAKIGAAKTAPGSASFRKPARPSAHPAPATQAAQARSPVPVAPGAVRSQVPGIVWPAIQGEGTGEQLSIAFQLEQTQWWSPERLRTHQFAQLSQLVRHAGSTVPYYRDLFARIGFDHRAPLDEAAWLHLPILTRREIQDSFTALQSEHYPAAHGGNGETGTSGSTGTPIKVRKTGLQELLWRAVSLRDHLWHRRDFSGLLAAIVTVYPITASTYPDGTDLPSWGSPFSSFYSGRSCQLNIATNVNDQVEWLVRKGPSYLTTFPANLEAIAHYCAEHGIALPTLRGLRTRADALRSGVRTICRSVFGLEIADMYSSAELGYIALQSPFSEELLVQAEVNFVEILDPSGRPCRPGEFGRVVVTPLHAFAMPLLRYASGDLAEVGEPASCGRGLPVIRRVLGRERQMMRLPTGEIFYPQDLGSLVAGVPKIRQFQLVRKTETSMEVRLSARAPLDGAEEAIVRARIHERFKFPFELSFLYLDVIPREPSGKFLDFKSEIG